MAAQSEAEATRATKRRRRIENPACNKGTNKHGLCSKACGKETCKAEVKEFGWFGQLGREQEDPI